MKKVVFCIGAMLIAATGFSQNESLIDQGKQNIADVNQVSTVDLYNFSDVYQRGENEADIDQIGQNSSKVEQHGQNFAIVYQDGGDGWNNLIQESEVVQRGKNNLADIMQFGERNQSYVDQANDGNTYGEGAKKGNKAKIYQEGNRNYSDVGQKDDANKARTTQVGNLNRSYTTQESYNAVESQLEDGWLQISEVDQLGYANLSRVFQFGDNNMSKVTQSADAPGDGYTNEAWVFQNGELGDSMIDQSDCLEVAANNYAIVRQTNDIGSLGGNKSTVLQKGANTANVTQVNGIDIH